MIRSILSVIVLSLCAVAMPAQQAISLSFEGAKVPLPASMIDFGLILNSDTTKTFSLMVQNKSKRKLTLDAFSYGNNLKAVWKSGATNPPATRAIIPIGGTEELLVNVNFTNNPNVTSMVTISEKKLIASVGVVYYQLLGFLTPGDPRGPVPEGAQRRMVQQMLSSGLGEWWQSYRLCLGASGEHFTLIPGSPAFIIGSHGDHPRNCASYSHCNPGEAGDTDVCETFEVQGHHEPDGTKDGHNEVLQFVATLWADYKLVPDKPQIYAIEAKTTEDTGKPKAEQTPK